MLSPEVRDIPKLARDFHRSGILVPVLKNFTSTDDVRPRDPFEDGRILREIVSVQTSGLENLPRSGANFLTINHPNVAILVPAALTLLSEFKSQTGRTDIKFLMGDMSRSAMRNRLGKYIYEKMLKGVTYFANTYPDNIILTTTNRVNDNYSENRGSSKQMVIDQLLVGNVVVLAPEGRVNKKNVLLDKTVPRHGAGEIALMAKSHSIPVLPTAIWKSQKQIHLRVGEPFFPREESAPKAVLETMEHIAYLLPEQFRGPYAGQIS